MEQNNDGVQITFENGVTVEADVLIGADGGAKLVVRNAVVDFPPKMRFWAAMYRSLVSIDQVPPSESVPNRTAWLPIKAFLYAVSSFWREITEYRRSVPRSHWEHNGPIDANVEDFLAEFTVWDEIYKP